MTSFRLAPMSPLVAVLTVGLLALPVAFVVVGLRAPGSVRVVPFGLGVGGLWGGFGWAWTSKRGLLDLYVSRTDGLVLVERRAGRPLLLTPERPDEFVRALWGA